ncbi:MAG TPA: ABC transporter permease [Bryobacteraceae bacterium]|jgi:predicted permease
MALYRLLLFLYPSGFRVQYSEELCSLFAHRLRETAGPLSVALLWFETLIDVLLTALQTHWDILRQDIVYTQRALKRSPGFALTAITVAALGVGATTAAYTITDHALLRPLPFPESDRLVKLWEDLPSYHQLEPSPPNYRDWKQMSKSFSAMAAFRGLSVAMLGAGEPQQMEGASVTSDLFPMLGAHAMFGRIFTPADDRAGAPGTVLLSYSLWKQKFASDPNILGRRLLLDGEPYVVIGVMDKTFGYPRPNVELWTPMRFANSDFADRNNYYLRVVAKLRPGVSIEQARSEMRIISERLKRQYPKENAHVGVTINPLRDEISSRSRLMLFALLGASFCVLLIACTNLANLLLARALERRKEVALRKALGAGRERLVRQLLTESLILALCGGLLGVLFAAAAVPLLSRLIPSALPVAEMPAVDSRVLLFALGVTVLTSVCFGVIPAARAANGAIVSGLQEGGRQGVGGRKEHLRAALVTAEIAISLVLLVSSGLLIRALWQLEQTNPGFRADHVLTLRTTLPMPKYEPTNRRVAFYTRVLSQVRVLPGVLSAGYTSFLPITFGGGIFPVTLPGQPENVDDAFQQASLRFITPGYLSAMGVSLLRGRDISESDTATAQFVAVVSESFVKQYWPNQNPLGRHFDFGFATRTVVGIAGNVRVRGVERVSEPQVYLSYKQVPDGWIIWYAPKDLAIRFSGPGDTLLPSIRRIIGQADPEQPISDVQSLTQIVAEDTAPRLIQLRVLGGFTLIAILLAGIGIHGLLSFMVSNRSQEIGVRIAVGAQSKDILTMIFRESLLLAGAGAAAGIVLAYCSARVLESLLAGVSPADPQTYAAGLSVAALTSFAGSLWPAFRALRVDPMTAIRAE